MSGPASVVANVVAARASPVIQTSGLSIDQSLPLTADRSARRRGEPGQGRAGQRPGEDPGLPGPAARGPSWSARSSRAPRRPGSRSRPITVDPPSVTVQGDAERLAALQSIDTEPVSISGASSHRRDDRRSSTRPTASRRSRPPRSTSPSRSGRSRPPATSRWATASSAPTSTCATRCPSIGWSIVGRRVEGRPRQVWTARRSSRTSTSATSTRARPNVDVTVDLPPGLTLVSATPATIPVTVTAPPPPSPSPSAAPSLASPSASPAG